MPRRTSKEDGPTTTHKAIPPADCPIVGIGASAGGLEAFQRLLKTVPDKTGMAFVLIQHLDPGHESILNKLLTASTHMPVREVTQAMPVEPDHVYIIPPNATM